MFFLNNLLYFLFNLFYFHFLFFILNLFFFLFVILLTFLHLQLRAVKQDFPLSSINTSLFLPNIHQNLISEIQSDVDSYLQSRMSMNPNNNQLPVFTFGEDRCSTLTLYRCNSIAYFMIFDGVQRTSKIPAVGVGRGKGGEGPTSKVLGRGVAYNGHLSVLYLGQLLQIANSRKILNPLYIFFKYN